MSHNTYRGLLSMVDFVCDGNAYLVDSSIKSGAVRFDVTETRVFAFLRSIMASLRTISRIAHSRPYTHRKRVFAILRSSLDGIFVTDCDGTCRFVSSSWLLYCSQQAVLCWTTHTVVLVRDGNARHCDIPSLNAGLLV